MLEKSPSLNSKEAIRPLNVKDALSYLDRVKAKFASQPETYNRFLDIMKDFKSQMIDTPGVIERVSGLFKGDPVLISGFNTFLPPGYAIECCLEKEQTVLKVITPSGTTTTISDSEALLHLSPIRLETDKESTTEPVVVEEIHHAIRYVHKVKGRFMDRPEVYQTFLDILQNYQKEGKPIHKVYEQVKVLLEGSAELMDEFRQFLPEPRLRKKRPGYPHANALNKKNKRGIEETDTSDVRSGNQAMDYVCPDFSSEEADFFERVKAWLNDRERYSAFLKVLDLPSMDQGTLIRRVEDYLGQAPELMARFKSLLGYYDPEVTMDDESARLASVECGPSYRYTPSRWQNNRCSGRDALCWEVLNDSFRVHPDWAHSIRTLAVCRKNPYEEALARVEEERYDYDLNIEANLNTVALLEPLLKKMNGMSVEEQAEFKLSSDTMLNPVYVRMLKKIYGAEGGVEMMQLIKKQPCGSVPILLARLKQKGEEWKRAQREWHKIWREVEAKNYWKSLDVRAIRFKRSDRQQLTMRSFVAEAEQGPSNPSFGFEDREIFKDVSRLVYFFLDRQPVYTLEDCVGMRRFMDHLVPMLWDVVDVEPSKNALGCDEPDLGAADRDEFDDDDGSSVQSNDSLLMTLPQPAPAGKRRGRRRRLPPGESAALLRNVLIKNTSQVPSDTEDEEREETAVEEEILEEEEEMEEEETESSSGPMEPVPGTSSRAPSESLPEDSMEIEQESSVHFMANDIFYCFVRLYHVLYDRLHTMKKLDQAFKKDPQLPKKACKEALDLGITPRRFKILIDKLLEGEVDQQTFEESTRYMFGKEAYILFTVHKLVLSLVRHIHIIMTDAVSQDLFELFQTERGDITAYKNKAVQSIDPAENVYQLDFTHKRRQLHIRLLDNNKHLRRLKLSDKDYQDYVNRYLCWEQATEGIEPSKLSRTFLNRNLCSKYGEKEALHLSGLQYKICRDTFHMFYIIGSEDVYTRRPQHTAPLRQKPWPAPLTARFREAQRAEQEAYSLYR
ncbi:hypothetical protein BY458DRAFT_494274 [Sporodiniella umbellata]|nr:hypothetical protein BY458DRAFT_494274 [Sporodiniella umbellata]